MMAILKLIFCAAFTAAGVYLLRELIHFGGPWFLAGIFFGVGLSCVVHRLEYGFWPTQKMPALPPNH